MTVVFNLHRKMLWAFLTVVLLSMITLDAGGRSPSAHNNEFAEFDDFEDDGKF